MHFDPFFLESVHLPRQLSCRTRPRAWQSSTSPCQSRPAHTMVRPCQWKRGTNQNLLPGSSLGGLRGAPSASGKNLRSEFFSKKCWILENSRFQDRTSAKQKLREAFPEMRRPISKQFAHHSTIDACLVSSSSRILHRLCHIHRCNLTVNSSSDLVILSSCKHLLNDSSSSVAV